MKKTAAFGIVAVLVCFTLTGCDSTPPQINGLDEESVEVMCGTDFNLDEYVAENIESITDETNDGTVEYELADLEYAITCEGDVEVYDSESGDVDTGEFGDFAVTVTVEDEAGNEASKSFTLALNPLEVQKGFYVYKSEYSDSFDLLGYCSLENKSDVALDISEIEFQYLDADGVTVTGTDLVDYAPQYLGASKIGYGYDTFSGYDVTIATEDEIQSIEVSIDYSRASSEDANTLEVGKITAVDDSGYAAEAVLTNPHSEKAEYYTFLVGMYDADDKLIGVMSDYGGASINAESKTRVTASWLPDSSAKPDATVRLQGAACVTSFAD